MELRNGPVSIFKIVFSSLGIANQAFGTALGLLIMMFLFVALLSGICTGVTTLINNPLGLTAISLPLPIVASFLLVVFITACVQIVASRFEKTGISAYESFRDCIVPSVYFIISSIILAVISYALMFLLSMAHFAIVPVAGGTVICLLMLPFCFTLQALILRNEGPLSALRYSWDLATSHYFRLLWNIFCLVIMVLFVILGIFTLCKALLPVQYAAFVSPRGIATLSALAPLWLIQLPRLYVFIGFIVCGMLALYLFLLGQAIWTGLFLNLDYSARTARNQHLEAQAQAAAQQAASVPSGGMPDIAVKQASVRTDADPETSRHLEQVYRAQEHLAHALEQEEDRMPTILFDEDMAKQLAENEEQMRQNKEAAAKRKKDDEPKSIRMSNKSL